MAASRLITSRYSGTCRKCRKAYRAGDRVYWTKGTRGAIHYDCAEPAETPGADNRKRGTSDDAILNISFAELCQVWTDCVDGNHTRHFKRSKNQRWARGMAARWNSGDSWTGGDSEQMKDWILRGYNIPGLQIKEPHISPEIHRRRIKYSEEGEFQYDLMRSGFDYPFLEWEKRPAKPGLKLEIAFEMVASTAAKVIAEYARWIAQAVGAVESAGIDCAIGVTCYLRGAIASNRNRNARVNIEVKRENEAFDLNRWSAIFAPTGFRMLVFVAIALTAERNNEDVDSGLGYPIGAKGFSVKFDDETRVMKIDHPSSPSHFPFEDMTAQLMAALDQAS